MHGHAPRFLVGWTIGLIAMPLFGCGSGSGGELTETEASVLETCDDCHDGGGIVPLITSVNALDDGVFTAERFPEAMFKLELRGVTVADLIANGNPPRDADLDPGMPVEKAWLLHELHLLELQLDEDPASDFATQVGFDDYNAAGEGLPRGCETIDRLDQASEGDPAQMPPLWTQPLFESLGRAFVPLDEGNRDALRTYVVTGLPGGMASCL